MQSFETVSNNILQVLIRDEIIIFTCMQKIESCKTLIYNIGIAVILYGIFVAILMMIKARSNQQYERIQKQREEEYKKN